MISVAPDASFLDLQNDKSFTVLHEAVACAETTVTRKLILAGANPAIRTISGNTPLHLACMHGNFECAQALLEPLSPMEKSWRCYKTGTQSSAVPQNLEIANFQGKNQFYNSDLILEKNFKAILKISRKKIFRENRRFVSRNFLKSPRVVVKLSKRHATRSFLRHKNATAFFSFLSCFF